MAPPQSGGIWDQLDEDWIDQAPSSPLPSFPVPLVSPAPAKQSPAVQKSRIPRFAHRRTSAPQSTSPTAARAEHNPSVLPSLESRPDPDRNKPTSCSRPSTNSSGGSVVHHNDGSIVRNPREPPVTPEWKKALRKQDLFSSTIGLEQIFQKPDQALNASPARKGYSFADENGSMPSSPPLMSNHLGVSQDDHDVLERPSQTLGDIAEEEESCHEQSGSDLVTSQARTGRISPQIEHHPGNAEQNLMQARSTTTSSVAEFSPVYISKHNTVDGKVNYAAFDPSELPEISKFVNLQRGGDTEDSSFHRKQMSSAASSAALISDSVAPSDSVSQVDRRAKAPDLTTHDLLCVSPMKESASRQASAPGNSRGPETASLAIPPITRSTKSSIETAFRADEVERSHTSGGIQFREKVQSTNSSKSSSPSRARPHVSEDQSSSSLKKLPPIMSKKRKDARYDQNTSSLNPSTVARREILRPRNSSIRSSSRPQGGQVFATSSSTRPSSVARGDFEKSISMHAGRDVVKARALASEVAAYQLKSSHPRFGELRKQSFSTQDYLNEAMKIMELIRARKNVSSEADSSDHGRHNSWTNQQEANMFSSDSFSRPPSRDGPRSGWRSERQVQVDPQVLSHLKKYEETGDESFLVTSIVRSVRAAGSRMSAGEDACFDQSASVQSSRQRSYSDSMLEQADQHLMSSPIKTQTSYQSNGSGQTIATTSTQRARTMRTIAPENISHLIREEEAGMRFDTHAQSWVRQRKPLLRPSAGLSSSTGTEANVLNEIPDLSVNEALETERSRVFSGQRQPWPATTSDLIEESESFQEPVLSTTGDDQENELDSFIHPETHDQEKLSHFAATKDELDAEDIEVLPTIERAETGVEYINALNPVARRREQSVLFSSPPVSREYYANTWTDSTGPNHESQVEHDANTDSQQYQPAATHGVGPRPPWTQSSFRTRSHSHIIESHEISFQEQGPNGRTLSMSLSLATPMPSRRSATVPALPPSSAGRQQSFLKTLSPMSEFSEHQSDEKHRESLALGQSLLRVRQQKRGFTAHAAQATEELVRHLTDAEPEEPYWDFMSRLDLSGNDMTTAHSLDVFCPRLEYLDASKNKLEHLQGMPSALRQLTISENRLSGLTNWNHLLNLQYLDVSHNNLTTLDGLGGLIHLRDLKAGHNLVTTINGILDLDGLLSVDLSHNRISSADFRTTCLKRLTEIDLSDNLVEEIWGLSELASLHRLHLANNQLRHFGEPGPVTNGSASLKVLRLSRNCLQALDIASFPRLKVLDADDNSLVQVDGVLKHSSLKILRLCNQTTKGKQDVTAYHHLEELHLSRSSLPARLPVEDAFLSLRILDVSHTGVQSLPSDFGLLAPNLQTLNLNSCHIKDLRPLLGIVGLRRLYCVGNRLGRLRSTVRVLKSLSNLRGGVLEEVDLRGNPLVHAFYPSNDKDGSIASVAALQRPTNEADATLDTTYAARLDDDTKMKRRIWELLIAAKCPNLKRLDGLDLDKRRIEARDEVWYMLVSKGVVESAKD